MTLGSVVGALSGGPVAQALGRKATLSLAALGFMSGYTLMYLSRGSTLQIYFSRVMTGYSMGLTSLCSPAYITEVTLPHQRGSLRRRAAIRGPSATDFLTAPSFRDVQGGGVQMAITIGIMYSFMLGKFIHWDNLALACVVPAALLLIASLVATESPRWHLLFGRRVTARLYTRLKVSTLHGPTDLEAQECLTALRGARADEEAVAIETVYLTAPMPTAHVLLALCVNFLQQFSGINMVIFYSFGIFSNAGMQVSEGTVSFIISLLQVFATLAAVALMDRVTRRRLLLLSSYVCIFSLVAMGAVSRVVSDQVGRERDVVDRFPVLLVGFYIVGFSIGLGPVVWLLNAELVPLRGSGILLSACCASNWIFTMAVTYFSDNVRDALGLPGMGWFFSSVTFAGALLVTFFLPETGHITLEEVLLDQVGFGIAAASPEAVLRRK
ncbi:facilitated trehalose transporter Tret1-like [Haemaphysalis longicornis]